MFCDTLVYSTGLSGTLLFLRRLALQIITIIITIITIRNAAPATTYNIQLLSTVLDSGSMLAVLVLVAKFVWSSVVAAAAEVTVDNAGADKDGDVWNNDCSVGVTLQFKSEYT